MIRSLLLVLALAAPLAHGALEGELLEPEKAFRFSARALGADALEVTFAIAEGYYMYRDRFRFEARGAQLGPAEMPTGERKKDEFFGDSVVYRKAVNIRVPVAPGARDPLELLVVSQGCADVGVCYVPMESRATLALASAQPPPALSEGPRVVGPAPRWSIYASDRDIAALFDGHALLVLAGFFGFGMLLTFTPCVLPMVPILSAIIAGEGKNVGKRRAAVLSSSYVLGMAVAYAAAGVAAAYSGSMLAAALQNPWVLGAFAAVFVWLALSMFGLYDIALPGFLHTKLASAHGRLRGGRIASVAAMGVLSAVIVSPCVAAPLAGALLYISQTRDVALGGTALFAMALGMGVPLIAVGVSEGALLPKAGLWMARVKSFFGVLLLAVAIWIISPVLPAGASMLAWAALLVGSGVFLRAVDRLPADARTPARLAKAVGILLLVAGLALLVGALAGSRDPLRPLAGLVGGSAVTGPLAFKRVNSPAELDAALRAPGRPVMLDFYADWCVSCKEMEAFTFSDTRVRQKLDAMLLLQADVTGNDDGHKALLKRFSLFGPPGIVFFDAQGREIRGLRVIGYQDADRFLQTLERALAP
ncbi:MAG: protein-disulfide reductase DsbD [Betaproteobacteria bacterium]|nr:protein-disulfide reductase DsbD [Betaproteobacteria bacterium]MDH5220373.1 protein-disulfide reductase DsbD [Betaproteobacteria bacterium]MDH5349945.1 protein-disulfide reductase DsbD [Betaproteobacteria bacterium]